MDEEGRIAAGDIENAGRQIDVYFRRVYDEAMAYFRETGEGNPIKIAKGIGCGELYGYEDYAAYKELLDASGQAVDPWNKRLKEAASDPEITRCYTALHWSRYKEEGQWRVAHEAVLDLDYNGQHFQIRERGVTLKEAAREVLESAKDIGLPVKFLDSGD